MINDIPDHKITPCIAGYVVKKLLGNSPIKWKAFLNKITCGHGFKLNSSFKSIIPHNPLHIELRDEGALIWPSRIVVTMAGIIIKKFDIFLKLFYITHNWSQIIEFHIRVVGCAC